MNRQLHTHCQLSRHMHCRFKWNKWIEGVDLSRQLYMQRRHTSTIAYAPSVNSTHALLISVDKCIERVDLSRRLNMQFRHKSTIVWALSVESTYALSSQGGKCIGGVDLRRHVYP